MTQRRCELLGYGTEGRDIYYNNAKNLKCDTVAWLGRLAVHMGFIAPMNDCKLPWRGARQKT